MAYSASQILTWAKTSQVLAYIDSVKKKAFSGGYNDPELHMKIWVEWQSLQWEYDQDPSSDNLFAMGNYVFALCFPYTFRAMLIAGMSGVSPTPVTPGAAYIYNEITGIVGTTSGLVNGAATYTHTDLIGGIDLSFMLLDNMVLTVGVDFSFDNSTGTITLLQSTWVTASNLVIPYNQLV